MRNFAIAQFRLALLSDLRKTLSERGVQLEGIPLPYPRDAAIYLADGALLVSAPFDDVPARAFKRYFEHAEPVDRGFESADHPFFQGRMGDASESAAEIGDLARRHGCTSRHADICFEGGNVFLCTDRAGHRVALVGEDNVIASHLQLRHNGTLNVEPAKSWIEGHAENITAGPTELEQVARQCITAGVFPTPEVVIDVPESEFESDSDYWAYVEWQTERQRIPPETLAQQPEYIAMARRFLAERAYVADVLFPDAFQLDRTAIHYMPQGQYHLDLAMTPGLPGEIFVQDYALSAELIEAFLEHTDDRDLTAPQRILLTDYAQTIRALAQDLGPVTAATKQALQQANLEVLATPGVFVPSDRHRVACFINGISGVDAGGRSYFATLGSFAPETEESALYARGDDCVGGILMELFATFMHQHVDDVIFCGDQNDNFASSTKMAAMTRSGLHCATLAVPRHED